MEILGLDLRQFHVNGHGLAFVFPGLQEHRAPESLHPLKMLGPVLFHALCKQQAQPVVGPDFGVELVDKVRNLRFID